MRNIWTVFGFTFKGAVKKKAFIISTIIVLALILIGALIISFVNTDKASDIKDSVESIVNLEGDKKSTFYLIDDDGLVPNVIDTLSKKFENIEFKKGTSNDLEKYKNIINEDDSVSAFQIQLRDDKLHIDYYLANYMTFVPSAEITEVVKQNYVSNQFSQAGVSQELIDITMVDITTEDIYTGKMDIAGYAVGNIMVTVMFMAIYLYGYFVSMSIASEKTSRVMETLVVSAKPSHILIGKSIAMGLLGLVQLLLFLITGAVCIKFIAGNALQQLSTFVSLSSLNLGSILLLLLYFILGYALFAMIYSVGGAMVNTTEDLNSALTPSMILTLISFFAAYFPTIMPGNAAQSFQRVLTFIPFTSSFIMPFRLLNDVVMPVEIIISLLILVVTIIIVSFFSIRIYSASVLHYGNRLKFKDLWKLQT